MHISRHMLYIIYNLVGTYGHMLTLFQALKFLLQLRNPLVFFFQLADSGGFFLPSCIPGPLRQLTFPYKCIHLLNLFLPGLALLPDRLIRGKFINGFSRVSHYRILFC